MNRPRARIRGVKPSKQCHEKLKCLTLQQTVRLYFRGKNVYLVQLSFIVFFAEYLTPLVGTIYSSYSLYFSFEPTMLPDKTLSSTSVSFPSIICLPKAMFIKNLKGWH